MSWLRTNICLALLASCTAYEPQPIDLREVLASFDAGDTVAALGDLAGDGLTARQAAAWAVGHNPGLAEIRERLGVADAELIEAGLLPNPEIGWDAMDALAVKINGGTAKTEEFFAGLGLTWPIPRPDEIDAKVGLASAHREEVRQQILTAEWQVVRATYRAHLDVLTAGAELALLEEQVALAKRTAQFFAEAREVGGATANQENLAAIEVAILEQERVPLQGTLTQARHTFNALLGLSPKTDLPLSATETAERPATEETPDADTLISLALEQRPDLAELLARYKQAEAALRLEIARQWPQFRIGSGLFLELPIFSHFNQPAIRTAIAYREDLRRRVRGAVFRLRAEINAAIAALDNARIEVGVIETDLLPRIQRALDSTDEAFRLREFTLFEILTTQRQVLDSRRRHLQARAKRDRAEIQIDTITGAVLMSTNTEIGTQR